MTTLKRLHMRTFKYSWVHRLNFVPGVLFILVLLYIVSQSQSADKIYGYITFGSAGVLFISLVFLERKKVAKEITVKNDGIVARSYFAKDIFMAWDDVVSMRGEGYSWWLISWKLQKTNIYAVLVSKNKRVMFSREIKHYDELASIIEDKTDKKFEIKI